MPVKHSKTDILILTTREGHASLAEAMEDELKLTKYHTAAEQLSDDVLGFNLYRLIYIYKPRAFKHIYQLAKKERATKLIDEVYKLALYPIIKKTLNHYQPKLIINTHFSFLAALHRYQRWHHLKVVNIIADPRQLVANEIYPQAEINTVFDNYQKQHADAIFPRLNLLETGWLVRKRFEAKYDKMCIRKKLKLKTKPLTFLFVSGYEGTIGIFDHLKKIVAETKKKSNPLQIVVACGKNDFLLQKMNKIKKEIQKNSKKINFVALPFTKNIHQYMQAADLVIGKAGPNTIFESIATRTPFFATTHINGLEDGSLEIIEEYKLGFVEENSDKIIKKLSKIIAQPSILNKFKPSLEKMAKKNAKARGMLVKEIQKLLE